MSEYDKDNKDKISTHISFLESMAEADREIAARKVNIEEIQEIDTEFDNSDNPTSNLNESNKEISGKTYGNNKNKPVRIDESISINETLLSEITKNNHIPNTEPDDGNGLSPR